MQELTKIEEILLWAIAELEDDAYGFRIRRHISARLGLDFTYGNLYSALGRLVEKGYVSKRQGGSSPARRGKTRVYYILQEDGRLALRKAYQLNRAMGVFFGKHVSEFGRS
jgi:PadR family transcriptional regulator, regulatory protein PadR